MGLINDIEGMEAMIYGNDDDEDLEAELARLQGREPAPKKKTSQPRAGKIYSRTLPVEAKWQRKFKLISITCNFYPNEWQSHCMIN